MNYYPGKPQTFKNICLKCNSTRFLDVPIMCCMWCVFSFFLLHIFYFWARSNWLLSCCDVPANVYILIVFFWVFFFFEGGGGGWWWHKGKSNKSKHSPFFFNATIKTWICFISYLLQEFKSWLFWRWKWSNICMKCWEIFKSADRPQVVRSKTNTYSCSESLKKGHSIT